MSVKKSVNALEYFGNSVGAFLKKGKITPAYRAVEIGSCPQGVRFAAYSELLEKFIFCTDSVIYESDDGQKLLQRCSYGAEFPFMVEDWRGGTLETVIITNEVFATYYDNSFLPIQLNKNLSSGVMHCGRLFGADGFTVQWSGPNNIAQWSGGIGGSGQLKLDPERGEILNILEFNGKLVAVRRYGLTVLSMYGSPENFSVDLTDTDCDEVYKNTSCVASGKLYFYSKSGLKCFDGTKISSVDIRHKISEPVNCAEYAGKYFLACKSCILCVDTDGESAVIDEGADYLFIKDGVYFCKGNLIKKLEEGGKYSFESCAIDFGTGRLKTVTKMDIQGTADIRISNGVCTRIFTGASGVIHPHLRGRSFKIKAEGESVLAGITVTAEVTDAI